eukprot:2602452-Rhodomonas_salina.2
MYSSTSTGCTATGTSALGTSVIHVPQLPTASSSTGTFRRRATFPAFEISEDCSNVLKGFPTMLVKCGTSGHYFPNLPSFSEPGWNLVVRRNTKTQYTRSSGWYN